MNNHLMLGLVFFGLSSLFGLAIFVRGLGWPYKSYLSTFSIVLIFLSAYFIINNSINIFSLIFMLSTLYSVINYLRLIKPKYVDDWLYNITKQTFLALTYSQLLFLTLSYYNNFLSNYLNYLILFYLLVSLYLAIYTTYRLKQTSVLSKALLAEDELPTVTVAIAARNEDMDLHSCLDSVLIDTYPKLEVLVYDDESQDRTADLIKQYAHDGVRFIKGGQIPEGWLAKNYAYQTLLNEASGEVVFFIGTDIRLHKNSIIQGISLMLDRQSDMVAVMPIRTKNGALASIIQPMRYWWELAVPRIFPKRPPTLSSSWFARRDKLVSIGGFKSYKKSIIPEEHLAKRFNSSGKYIFARSNSQFFVSSHKNFYEQWETLVRIRYPQVHRRPELVFFRNLFLIFLLVPFLVVIPVVMTSPFSLLSILALWVCALLLYTHIMVSWYTNHFSAIVAPLNFPIIILVDLVGINLSMYRYEFSQVIWKDRVVNNKLTAIAHLPKLD